MGSVLRASAPLREIKLPCLTSFFILSYTPAGRKKSLGRFEKSFRRGKKSLGRMKKSLRRSKKRFRSMKKSLGRA
jgi:hypothetical protein